MSKKPNTIAMLLNRIAMTFQPEEPAKGMTKMLLSEPPDQLVTEKVADNALNRAFDNMN